jgi:hypothetical protein
MSAHGALSTTPAQRLTVLLTVRDHAEHRSVAIELLQRAQRAGMAGATLFHASEGYGASGTLHRPHVFTDDEPVSVVIVDTAPRLRLFLDANDKLLAGVAVTVEDVEVVHLSPRDVR